MKDVNIYKRKVQLEEGFRDTVYKDHLGIRTFGYGHNIEANPIPTFIIETIINKGAKDGAEQLFKYDLNKVVEQLNKRLPWWSDKPIEVRTVLVDMVFNMGIRGVSRFKTTLKYMQRDDFRGAGLNLMASRYAEQVPNRAKRNKELLDSLG